MVPTILIPAYNPDEKLQQTIRNLREAGYTQFVVVDDGSRPDCWAIFDWVAQQEDILLLRHSVNCGKGRAMKTGFNEILCRKMAQNGVIVCDADGQHPIAAINSVAQQMLEHPDCLVLGVRKFFEADNVPLPNLLGNTITRAAFYLITGIRYGDTQCGLRGFPEPVIRQLMTVSGERFEYENTMLLAVRSLGIPVCQVPMEALYLDDNKSSHFHRIHDSVRIYKTILGFAKRPFIAAILHFLLFYYLRSTFPTWWGPTAAYGIGLLAGYLFLLFSVPGVRKFKALAGAVVLTLAACALQFILGTAGIPAMGAWWILALPLGLTSYYLWVGLCYGPRPLNYRLDLR